MANFQIPSLNDVLERTRQAFKSNMPESDPWLWPSNIYVSAKVIAGRIWECFHRLDWVLQQAFVLTATGQWLARHGKAFGITRKAAIASYGTITGTGATPATFVPAGSLVQRSDGFTFETIADYTVPANGEFSINVRAQETGTTGNTAGGAPITFASAITGLPASATVSAAMPIGGGRDIESDEELRVRILQRLQYPPHAGTRQDYVRWALEIPGVTRVYVEPRAFGPGTIGIWPLLDGTYQDGIPQTSDIAMIQASIDAVAPVTATAIVMAAELEPVRIEIEGLTPYNSAVVENVKKELAAMIDQRAAVSMPSDIKYIRRSWIWQAVANATGQEYHSVRLPVSDVAISSGKIAAYDERYITIVPPGE